MYIYKERESCAFFAARKHYRIRAAAGERIRAEGLTPASHFRELKFVCRGVLAKVPPQRVRSRSMYIYIYKHVYTPWWQNICIVSISSLWERKREREIQVESGESRLWKFMHYRLLMPLSRYARFCCRDCEISFKISFDRRSSCIYTNVYVRILLLHCISTAKFLLHCCLFVPRGIYKIDFNIVSLINRMFRWTWSLKNKNEIFIKMPIMLRLMEKIMKKIMFFFFQSVEYTETPTSIFS